MAERKRPSEAKFGMPIGWDPTSLVSANQKALECWSRAVSALTEEVGQFMQARLQEDMGIWGKLTSCKDASQVFECQRQFVQKAATDYLDQANKLSRITMDLAGNGLAPFQEQTQGSEKAAA